jgi:thermostable 8-oxoguanine DNA glycosylase
MNWLISFWNNLFPSQNSLLDDVNKHVNLKLDEFFKLQGFKFDQERKERIEYQEKMFKQVSAFLETSSKSNYEEMGTLKEVAAAIRELKK